MPQATVMLAETCSTSARHSFRLLVQSWINGSLPALDYLSAQYLFAVCMVLAISSLCFDANSHADRNDYQSAHHLLSHLHRLGNIAAGEFCQHADQFPHCISQFETERGARVLEPDDQPDPSQSANILPFIPTSSGDMTTEMAIFQPLLQDFLVQADTELCVPLPSDYLDLDLGTPWPHEPEPEVRLGL